MKRITVLLLIALRATLSTAQQSPANSPATEPENKQAQNLLEAFERGRFQGNFRSYFMATDNTRDLTDYHAWAAGGSLFFQTAPWHGFSAGMGGMFNYKILASDLTAKDPRTGAVNRYEIGLFDVENPQNNNNLDRVEELWLRYTHKKASITIGQQALQSPFINHQDGRMRPTVESGVWVETNAVKNTKIEGGWLWRISPRSTVRWYDIGASIGLYPRGLNPDGTASGYPENVQSAGIALLGITRQVGKRTRIQVWDQYVENVFNTAFAQADYTHPLQNGHKLLFGLQLAHQDALADGGNPDVSKTYFEKGGQSNTISTQAGWARGNWQALAAYTRVTADGRFLSPREWGREPFYTFITRERMEGYGDSHSATGRVIWQTTDKKLRMEAAYGHFYLPDVRDNALNKYAFPAFNQFNFDVRYAFGGTLRGLRAQFIYVWKGRLGEVYDNDKYVINKVDMSLYNLILNYSFSAGGK
ncbi:MAG: outer membrane porin, OprD family [Lewinellaceae bacterium]|nr:outer membrane porin, OprD family [Lewinellaceae bacterium]